MNGREIKNAVKLARLLAVRRKQDLAPGHIDEVLHALNGDMWEEDEEESEESQQEGEASEHPAERGIQQLDAAAADANSNRNERVVSTESA